MKTFLTFITFFISFNSFALVVKNQPICERPSRKVLIEFETNLNQPSHELFQNKMEQFFNKACWDDIEPKMLVDKLYTECTEFANDPNKDSSKLNTASEFQARCETLKQHSLILIRASEVAKRNKCDQKKEDSLNNLDNFLQKPRSVETLEKY